MSAPRGEAARRRIIESTCQLILDEGLDGFSIEAVAAASGAARSTVYRHWPEPRDLVVEVLRTMGQALPAPDTGSLHSDLAEFASILRPIFDDPRTRRLILDVTRAAADDSELEMVRQQLRRDRQLPVQTIIQRAIARGEIDPEIDMEVALHLVEGPWLSATVFQNRPLSDEAIEAMIARVVRALS
jgi:AcrR family transcriptional regulator